MVTSDWRTVTMVMDFSASPRSPWTPSPRRRSVRMPVGERLGGVGGRRRGVKEEREKHNAFSVF